MKRQNLLVLLALVMLVTMNLASCKMSIKPAAETSRIGEIPEAAQYIVGIEKFNTPIDYSQAECWLDVPAAMVKDGVLDGTAAADSLKAVDVFYIYPTVTGFRPETEVCDMTADGAVMFGPESYHLHDYGFFFNNFKQNVVDRIKAFLEK